MIEGISYLQNRNKYSTNKPVSFSGHKLVSKFIDPNYGTDFVYKLSNGLKVVIVPKGAPSRIHLRTVVKTGAINDTKNGLSHITEHMLSTGSKGLGSEDINKIFENEGADLDAFTELSSTSYAFSVSGATYKTLSKLIKKFSKMIKYPLFQESMLNKEKEIVIQEIRGRKDESINAIYSSIVNKIRGNDLKDEDCYAGSEEAVKKITRNDIIENYKKGYHPDNMEIYVSGPINPQKMIKIIDENFDTPDFKQSGVANLPEELHFPNNKKPLFMTTTKDDLSTISVSVEGAKNKNGKETVAINALFEILFNNEYSRLGKKLNRINSSVSCLQDIVSSNPNQSQLHSIIIAVDPDSEQKALNALSRTIKELKTEPITQEELNMAKRILLDRFNEKTETPRLIVETLEKFTNAGGICAYKNQIKYINELTLDNINQAAKKYVIPKKFDISVMQPKNKQNKNVSFKSRGFVNVKDLKGYTLPNNIKVVINDSASKNRTSIYFNVKSGNFKVGAARILTKMFNESSSKVQKQKSIMDRVKLGINDLTFEYTDDSILLKAQMQNESLIDTIRTIKKTLFNFKFSKSGFEAAKAEFSAENNDKSETAMYRVVEAMYNNLSNENLKPCIEVSFKDVQDLYAELFKSNNSQITAIITGPISKMQGLRKDILKELSTLKGKFNIAEIPPRHLNPTNRNKVVVQTVKNIEQSDIVQMFHIEPENIKEIAALNVLDYILGRSGLNTRLFKDLREDQKIAYDVNSTFANKGGYYQTTFSIKTSVADEKGQASNNIKKTLTTIQKHLKQIMDGQLSLIEIEIAKKKSLNDFESSASFAQLQNKYMLAALNMGEDVTFHNRLMQEIRKVTLSDISNAAKKYYTKPSAISILTTKEAATKSEKFLKSIGEYVDYKDKSV